MRSVARELVAVWLTLLYGHAWGTQTESELAAHYWRESGEFLADDGVWDDVGSMQLIFSAGHRIQWMSANNADIARREYARLRALVSRLFASGSIEDFGVLALGAVCDVQLDDRPQAELAAELLAGDRVLTAPMRLRLLCGACDGRLDELLRRLPEITEAARDHRALDPPEETTVTLAYRRASDWSAVTWAVRTLIQASRHREALDLLAAWAPAERPEPLLERPLFVLPTVVAGTVWALDDRVAPDPEGPHPNTLPELARIAEEALGTWLTMRFNVDERPRARLGTPEDHHALAYEAICRKHLRLDDLAAVADPDAAVATPIVCWPQPPAPVRALVRQAIGTTPPLSASLREPEPERPIRHIWVMGAGSLTSEIERLAVARLFGGAGADVSVDKQATWDAFQAAFAADPDLIWLCSHGEYDHAVPHGTGLVFDDRHRVSLSELAELGESPRGRRLIVLNVCDAGASAMRPGAMALGIGAALAGPRQTVIGHLWPVHFVAASTFGVLLAAELAAGRGHAQAFDVALAAMASSQQDLEDRLRTLGAAGEEMADRVQRSSVDFTSVFAWGSAALII